MKDRSAIIVPAVTLALILAAFILSFFARDEEAPDLGPKKPHLHCVLELRSLADTSKALMIGYNYHLVKQFAADNEQSVEIILTDRNVSYLDSLRSGTVDIVVVPFGEELCTDSLLMSTPLDSVTVWLTRHDDHRTHHSANEWISAWNSAPESDSVRVEFMQRYNPFRSKVRKSLSPYDAIMKREADSLGLDWRMLAAIIYKESHFHIEAVSSRGAAGLMQLMPANARNYGITDPLDPEQNIKAGAMLLKALYDRYARVAANNSERYKYALAAYNAGVGRIRDCINLAKHLGVDPSYWINIVNIIPQMGDESILETGVVKIGTFKGVETISYVDRVLDLYRRFCQICPE